MKAAAAGAVKRGLLGVGHYARRLREDVFPGVAVLCYHGVRPDSTPAESAPLGPLHVSVSELDAHCRLVGETCHPVSLDQWRTALHGGPALPPRPVLVTFDDGYRSVLMQALPVLQRHGIPAGVFVCSDPVAQQRLLWYDAVARRLGEPEVERWKRLPYPEWRAACAETATVAAAPNDLFAPMSPEEVTTLGAAPGIEIGGHGASHAILARADEDAQRDEITRNRSALEDWTRRPVRAFAYPNGRPGEDYTSGTAKLLEELGFDFAFTTRPGFARSEEPALERSRFLMLAGISAAELAHRLTYSWRR